MTDTIYGQADHEAVVANENALLAQAQLQHFQNRCIELALQVHVLKAASAGAECPDAVPAETETGVGA